MKISMKSILAAGLVAAVAMGAQTTQAAPCVCGCGDTAACTCTDCVCCGAVGRWAIQKPGAFWLGIFQEKGSSKATAQLLWGGGSPNDQSDVTIVGDRATMRQRCGKNR